MMWSPEGDYNYFVMDTDYDNYAVIYGCDDRYWLYRIESTWLLTRERNSENLDEYKQIASEVYREKVPHYDWEGLKHDTYHGEDCIYSDRIEALIDE